MVIGPRLVDKSYKMKIAETRWVTNIQLIISWSRAESSGDHGQGPRLVRQRRRPLLQICQIDLDRSGKSEYAMHTHTRTRTNTHTLTYTHMNKYKITHINSLKQNC